MKTASLYRKLPSVDALLQRDDFQALLARYPRTLVLQTARHCLAALRSAIRAGMEESVLEATLSRLPRTVAGELERCATPGLKRVINATGVVIHTNLGRAPIAPEAIDFLQNVATGYCNLEYDLETGERSHRENHLEQLWKHLTGHDVGAAVVNNNAAAVLLILETLASGGEVIVSRGELVEIGGSFRIPEILEKSGARLREVGTTNKTRADDYARAISDSSRLILRVHPSNFQIMGFTERPALAALSKLAVQHGLPLAEDLGSGLISDLPAGPLRSEPSVCQSLDAGVDLVCFSGDKLLGATQAGIILGKRKWIQQIRRNPLMRALRADKTAYGILLYSLYRYLNGEAGTLPVHRLLTLPADQIRSRAQELSSRLENRTAELRASFSLVGGGSAPEVKIPTFLLAVRSGDSAESLHRFLRQQPTPIVARIEDDCVVFDLRTVLPEEDTLIAAALNRFFASAAGDG